MAEQSALEKYCGIGVSYITSRLGLADSIKGNIIQHVDTAVPTPAERAGIKNGAVITAVDPFHDGRWIAVTSVEHQKLMQGPPDTELAVRFINPGEAEKEAVVVRDVIARSIAGHPSLTREEIMRLPEREGAVCSWNVTSTAHGLPESTRQSKKTILRS